MNADGTDQNTLSKDTTWFDCDPYWSPDGKLIVFSSKQKDSNYHIYTMNTDGTNRIQITFGRGEETNPAWLQLP
jgi:Tol biopolymer transport system component